MTKKELKKKLENTIEKWDEIPHSKEVLEKTWGEHLDNLVEKIIDDFREYAKKKCSLIYDDLTP